MQISAYTFEMDPIKQRVLSLEKNANARFLGNLCQAAHYTWRNERLQTTASGRQLRPRWAEREQPQRGKPSARRSMPLKRLDKYARMRRGVTPPAVSILPYLHRSFTPTQVFPTVF